MSWNITIDWGSDPPDRVTVEAPTLGEAVAFGLDELGFDSNDEGSITIKVSGDAGALSTPVDQPIRRKKKNLPMPDERNPFEKTDDPR